MSAVPTTSHVLFFGFASFVATLGRRAGRQAGETGRDKASGRRTHHPTTVGRLVNARREASPYVINIDKHNSHVH